MRGFTREILQIGLVAAAVLAGSPAHAASVRSPMLTVGEVTRPPIGWVEFCQEHAPDCVPDPAAARDTAAAGRSWREVLRINTLVNETIRPLTDLEHHGVMEKWSYPSDGYGDCEDYVLLKRRMLMDQGWPRAALLVTVVRDQKGDGHAVLTVSTNKGDFILDNQTPEVRLWSETPYRYVKRQSQIDPNVWVSIGDPRPTVATATSR